MFIKSKCMNFPTKISKKFSVKTMDLSTNAGSKVNFNITSLYTLILVQNKSVN